jgi:hypothetical protein
LGLAQQELRKKLGMLQQDLVNTLCEIDQVKEANLEHPIDQI